MKSFILGKEKKDISEKNLVYDVVVAGGGVSGLSAAIAAARHGARTAIIQDRSVFGGNASSEAKMHISGASCHWGKKNATETGILHEIILENKYLNDSYNFSLWDSLLWDAAMSQSGLDVYLNTTVYAVDCVGGSVTGLHCYRMTTEEHFLFTAGVYMDCTGHGTLGAYAGAEYRIGCEAADEYGEPDAPAERNGNTMGNTIYFVAEDKGHPVEFKKPRFAYSFDESDFVNRPHGDVIVYHNANEVVVLPKDFDYENSKELVEKYDVKSGYWWLEIGGNYDDIIGQAEEIRDELLKSVYGIWDHIKNFRAPNGENEHGAENYELVWVGAVPGIRESRRLIGDYMLSQSDIYGNVEHDDGVAYGGWPMDEHTAGGFLAKGQIPSRVISYDGFYSIPYRCFYSKNIGNLMMAGRNISATKLGMSSTRVMGTCAVGGQAAGTAAALAVKYSCSPREVGQKHIEELRQTLLRDDCYIPGCKNTDENDLARRASVMATSEKAHSPAENVINGISRTVGENSNMWESDGISPDGEALTLKLARKEVLKQVRLTFDPNLSEEKCISVSKAFMDKQRRGTPPELVKDYTVGLYLEGKRVLVINETGNHLRHRIHDLPPTEADEIKITVKASNGCENARIYEVRAY